MLALYNNANNLDREKDPVFLDLQWSRVMISDDGQSRYDSFISRNWRDEIPTQEGLYLVRLRTGKQLPTYFNGTDFFDLSDACQLLEQLDTIPADNIIRCTPC